METCNLNDRNTFTASDSLLAEANGIGSNVFVNLSYTDYGGTFYEKCMIDFLIVNYHDNIIWENTIYNGKNAFVFGEIAEEIESLEGFEDYLYEREDREREKAITDFIGWYAKNIISEKRAMDCLYEYASLYCSSETFGLDYSENKFIKHLKNNKLWKQD